MLLFGVLHARSGSPHPKHDSPCGRSSGEDVRRIVKCRHDPSAARLQEGDALVSALLVCEFRLIVMVRMVRRYAQ